ncbi:GL16544 [Drosophila persimilis]|uniref:GL16544 n=1 Tax=Drosophila persimilis TaxID=7234 RepID=B4GWF5_DROPE|nr:GL16544 [Drosophila persimilis]
MSIRNIHVYRYGDEEDDSPTTDSEGSMESVRSEWSEGSMESMESVRSEWSEGSDSGERSELPIACNLVDTQAGHNSAEEEEELPPAGDSDGWDLLLLATVALLFLVRFWHKDYLQYLAASIRPPGPALSGSAWPLYTGLMWFTSAVLYRLLLMRARVSEWERCQGQRQRRLEKPERRFMRAEFVVEDPKCVPKSKAKKKYLNVETGAAQMPDQMVIPPQGNRPERANTQVLGNARNQGFKCPELELEAAPRWTLAECTDGSIGESLFHQKAGLIKPHVLPEATSSRCIGSEHRLSLKLKPTVMTVM